MDRAETADKGGHLTVFQRRANWAAPLNNSKISEAEMTEIRRRYDEIFATCARTTWMHKIYGCVLLACAISFALPTSGGAER